MLNRAYLNTFQKGATPPPVLPDIFIHFPFTADKIGIPPIHEVEIDDNATYSLNGGLKWEGLFAKNLSI